MGFHWSPCNPFSAILPISIAIACVIIAPKMPVIVADVMHGLEICCWILGGAMFLTGVVFALLMRGLMPRHVIFIRGNPQFFTEALNEPEDHDKTIVGYVDDSQVHYPPRVALPSRSTVEWQAPGQFYVPQRRNKRRTR